MPDDQQTRIDHQMQMQRSIYLITSNGRLLTPSGSSNCVSEHWKRSEVILLEVLMFQILL